MFNKVTTTWFTYEKQNRNQVLSSWMLCMVGFGEFIVLFTTACISSVPSSRNDYTFLCRKGREDRRWIESGNGRNNILAWRTYLSQVVGHRETKHRLHSGLFTREGGRLVDLCQLLLHTPCYLVIYSRENTIIGISTVSELRINIWVKYELCFTHVWFAYIRARTTADWNDIKKYKWKHTAMVYYWTTSYYSKAT